MNPEEFKEAMQEAISQGFDEEITHKELDNLMCILLRQLGYGEGVDIFEKAEKWYA